MTRHAVLAVASPFVRAAALAAAFCACAEQGAAPQSPAVRPTPPLRAEPARPPADGSAGARIELRAPIVRTSVRVAESHPPQLFADVVSALPDGCTRFARTAVRRDGDVVFVDVFNTRPARSDVACTMIYGEKETAVTLGTDFAPGRTYTLDVNGTRQTFVAP
jgi:hypothetical protein